MPVSINEVTARIRGVSGHDSQFYGKCPCHDDKSASLSIGVAKDGAVLLHCHAGCRADDIRAELGFTREDLGWIGGKGSVSSSGSHKSQVRSKAQSVKVKKADFHPPGAEEAQYNYGDQLLKIRYRCPDGSKTFRWWHKENDGWILGNGGIKPPLYHKGEENGTETVLVVEGEKDVDNGAKAGFYVLSPPDGAAKEGQTPKWYPRLTEEMKTIAPGLVVIVQDNDEPGRAHAEYAADCLFQAGIRVEILDLTKLWPGLPEKGDLSDYLEHEPDSGPAHIREVIPSLQEWPWPMEADEHDDDEHDDDEMDDEMNDDVDQGGNTLATLKEAKVPGSVQRLIEDHRRRVVMPERIQNAMQEVSLYGGHIDIPAILTPLGQAYLFAEKGAGLIRYSPSTDWIVWSRYRWVRNKAAAKDVYNIFLSAQYQVASQMQSETEIAIKHTKDKEKRKKLGIELERVKSQAIFFLKQSTSSNINGVLDIAKSHPLVQIEVNDLDNDPYTLNTPKGEIDLKTGNVSLNNPAHFCSKSTRCGLGEQGREQWETFIDQITDGNKELADYIQVVAGMGLIGETLTEQLICVTGEGSNGKSVLFNSLVRVIGDYGYSCPAEMVTKEYRGNTRFDLSDLVGKRLVLLKELGKGKTLDDEKLKSLISRDPKTAAFKGKDSFVYQPSHNMVMYSNNLPEIEATDYGTTRRIAVVPMTHTFVENSKETNVRLENDLVENAGPAILKWAVDGAVQYCQSGYKLPTCKVVDDATRRYKDENDRVGAFLRDRCEFRDISKVNATVAYEAFTRYVKAQGLKSTMTQTMFGTEIAKRGIEKKREGNGMMYLGLRLIADGVEAEEKPFGGELDDVD